MMEHILPLTNCAMRSLEDLEHLFQIQAKATLDTIVIKASRIAIADDRKVIAKRDIEAAAFGREHHQ